VGFGMDSFALTFPAFAPAELNTLENLGDYSDRAHNFLLDYAQQFGLPALALFLFFLGLIFASGIKNIFKKVENTHGMADSWLAELALLSGLTALFIANLFGFFVTVTWVYFWLFAALLLRMRAGAGAGAARETPHAREVSTQFLSRKYAGTLFITIVIIAVIPPVMLNDMNLLRSDIAYRESAVDLLGDPGKLFEAATVSPEMSLYSIAAADANTAAAQYFAQQAGKITAYDGVYEFTAAKLFASKKSTKIGGLDATIAGVHFENALQKMPNHPFVYLEYGRYLLANNQPAKAAAMFEKMLSITPDYYSWRDGLETKTPAEQEKYRIFYKLNPDFNKVFELLTDAERKAGNPEKARYYEQYLYY
jgi:tetratricopeptide (TPR) repeat protein